MKRLNERVGAGALLLAGSLLSGGAHAAFTTYTGVNDSAVSFPTGKPAEARKSFLDQLIPELTVSDGLTGTNTVTGDDGVSFKLKGGGTVSSKLKDSKITNAGCNDLGCTGRFNTTLDEEGPWWETMGNFDVTFTNALSAFGFYATDIGDFGARVKLQLRDEAGKVIEDICFGGTQCDAKGKSKGIKPLEDGSPSGSLLFFGFTDTERLIKSIRFDVKQGGSSSDYFGFDDFVTGPLRAIEPPPGVPEPATLALVAASLAALAATRRRRGS